MDKRIAAVLAVIVVVVVGGFFIGGGVLRSGSSANDLSVLQDHLLLADDTPFQRVVLQDLDEESRDGFYRNAENNDELFVLQNRVVLYRPSEDKIIDIAPYLGGENFDPEQIDPEQIEALELPQ